MVGQFGHTGTCQDAVVEEGVTPDGDIAHMHAETSALSGGFSRRSFDDFVLDRLDHLDRIEFIWVSRSNRSAWSKWSSE
jgi:hypothetical protein